LAPTRPTILQIIPALDTGGAELSTLEIAQAIVAAGGRALVATHGGRLAEQIIAAGGEIIPFPAGTKNPARMMTNARALAAIIRREHVDIVHARSRAPAWSALSAARATKRPFITTYHGAYSENGPLKRAYNSVMARGDVVIANSAFTARLIIERYRTPADRIRIIHRGVDPAVFNRAAIAPSRLDALRQSWQLAPGSRVILHAARLTRWKGQSVVIDALAKLARRGSEADWVAVFAGDDQGRCGYREDLERQIAGLGLSSQVRLVGHVADMPAAFALASVALIASTDPEAFGRTAIEAQMMGCPVIATRIGAPPETVRAEPDVAPDQVTGWLVAPGNADALAAALAAALGLAEPSAAGIAQRARANASINFSLAAMKRATLAVYDEVLETRLAEGLSSAICAVSPQP
jgi:glycosyltransferase involved in cell wall biosynthesis